MKNPPLPKTQYAVQLVGPGELKLNADKDVLTPGPRQVLARVEAVGLCFSDLKLLKQFSDHVRKSEIVRGIAQDVLREIPSYVPGGEPTVPGHEGVVRIVAVGDQVQYHQVGERCLVQTDYRDLRTADSNASCVRINSHGRESGIRGLQRTSGGDIATAAASSTCARRACLF